MNTGFRGPSILFRSIHRLMQNVVPQLSFSFYRHQLICVDFSGGQITSDAGDWGATGTVPICQA